MTGSHRKRVAVTFTATTTLMARNLQGIADYARAQGGWTIVNGWGPDSGPIELTDLRGWRGDGIIALVNTPESARIAPTFGIPVLNASGAIKHIDVPRVPSDHLDCGRLAAEHLLECRFRRFAYYGLRDVWFSELFHEGFAARLAQDGCGCEVLQACGIPGAPPRWDQDNAELDRWLLSLETPVGLLACNDPRGRMVTDACERVRLRVPEDVAVMGISNNELTCEFSHPPLTSIVRNGVLIGWEAASMLDRMMLGKPFLPPPDVSPLGIVRRASTDVEVIADPIVAQAARLLREQAGSPARIDELLAALPRSRRWLEQRFRDCLSMSPYEYLCRTRVKRAQLLLDDPRDLLLKQVAHQCGLSDERQLRILFERYRHITPMEYRRKAIRGEQRPED